MQEQKEQIGRNSKKFVRNSYEFHTNFTFPEYSHKFIHVKFVRNSYEIGTNFVRISYEFHVNFVQFANTQSKHTSRHTLHSHGQVMLHAPVFAHFGDRHTGTVFTRCHSVVCRPGGGNAGHGEVDLRLRIDIVPLAGLQLVHAAHEEQHALLADLDDGEVGAGADREMKVGWKGQVGGPAGTVWGGSAKRAWAASPSHNPTLPTAPFPTHNTWSTLGQSQLDKSLANVQGLLGGGWRASVLCWPGGVCVGGRGSTS